MIKLVAFDLDGTVADTLPTCIKAFKEAIEPYVHRSLSEKDVVRTFGLDEEGMVKQVVDKEWKAALEDFYRDYEKLLADCPGPVNGITELIEWLKSKSVIVNMITGKSQTTCAATLKHFGMDKTFEQIETGSPVKNRKAEAMKEMLAEYQLKPDEMVYVGDAPSDITACREAGIRCLSAAWATFPQVFPILETENKGNVFYSVEELQDFFKKVIC